MRFDEFAKACATQLLISHDFLNTLGFTKGYGRLLFHRWVKAGKIIRLKRGLYALPSATDQFSTEWLANYLYSPSYVSLHYVLSYYDMIPEVVARVTSVSTRKTARFDNAFGVFDYHHIKREFFFGFEMAKDEYGKLVQRATPEKALLDCVYYDTTFKAEKDYFLLGMRLQQVEKLKKKRIKEYAERFTTSKMRSAAQVLLTL